ncbi:MAG: AarF/ABC1/UbiB kinase family protein, partial [Pseudomonadota bacterium]
MKNDVPTSKLKRGLAGGKTAAKVGKKILTYYSKRPFLTTAGRLQAKEQATLEGAEALFQGLSLLKGTALKLAQQLSLEVNLLPEEVCRELARAYHQVPPINRALVRRV